MPLGSQPQSLPHFPPSQTSPNHSSSQQTTHLLANESPPQKLTAQPSPQHLTTQPATPQLVCPSAAQPAIHQSQTTSQQTITHQPIGTHKPAVRQTTPQTVFPQNSNPSIASSKAQNPFKAALNAGEGALPKKKSKHPIRVSNNELPYDPFTRKHSKSSYFSH